MLFHTFPFLIFFLAVYIFYIHLNRRWQNWLLLAASYFFYGSWDWRFLSLIWVSTIVDYICGKQIYFSSTYRRKKIFLVVSLCANLGLLGFFKYANFFISSFSNLLSTAGIHVPEFYLNVILPVGISFYTFQTLSYTIDIYYGKMKPERNLRDFALFVAFFPQLVAGPIERAVSLLPQIKSDRRVNYDMIREGLWLFFYGLFLKVVVADQMAVIADKVFSQGNPLQGGFEALMGIYAFAFQIFGDFAGYSSMAIGISKLFGINLMTNFLYPYFVTNPSDFWRNWHISLSTWLKDYLYIPLGGNRAGRFLTYRNLMITMILGGLWHGAAWTFVAWGVYQGGVLVLHRVLADHGLLSRPKKFQRVIQVVMMIGMFQVTSFGWLIFRAQSLAQIGTMAQSIAAKFLFNVPAGLTYLKQILVWTAVFWVIHIMQKLTDDQFVVLKSRGIVRWGICGAMACSIVFVIGRQILAQGTFSGQPFIYFQF